MHENQQKRQFLIDMVRNGFWNSMITNEPADHAAVYTTFAKLEIVEIRLT